MKIGVSIPQTDIGTDPVAFREFAQAVEELGYDHLVIYDHVVGADPAAHPGSFLYTHRHMFHEPLVTLGFLAGCTRRLGFATAILILPQRQTALVAKQAAEIDVLSAGRLRLGVGVGWNQVEYQALGEDFRTRGARMEEQIHILRALWTQESVTFHGRWHHIEAAGISPLPVQRPIPIWMGGDADVVLRRTSQLADGWFPRMDTPTGPPTPKHQAQLHLLRRYLIEAGRDPHTLGIEPHMNLGEVGPQEWSRVLEAWRAFGATHLFASTMGAGFKGLDGHLQAIHRFREVAGSYI